jgi:hypothetical protein
MGPRVDESPKKPIKPGQPLRALMLMPESLRSHLFTEYLL